VTGSPESVSGDAAKARADADTLRIPAPGLLAATSRVFAALGLPEDAAGAVAQGLVDADMRGIPSHGLMLVPMYAERMQAGSVTAATSSERVADLGAIAVLDAGNALGILSGDEAMALAVERAGEFGIGAVAVRHAFHFGGAFRFALAAAEAGLTGIAAANTRPLMPAPGGAQAVVGNNPLAIAVPTADGGPIVLDMALSEAALGKIRLAAQAGREIPPSWATDAEGTPTTDPEAAIAGLLLPAAGPKGYGLAFMVDVLTGVLSGGSFGAGVKGLYADAATPNDCAHLFLAIDPAAFGQSAEEFGARVTELAAQVAASPTAPGSDRVRLPGQLEGERYAAAEVDGVPVQPAVLGALRDLAASLGLDLEEDLGTVDEESTR
jgi:LDH2 family malate/lactate/ureidoglycolate dehydrogenase